MGREVWEVKQASTFGVFQDVPVVRKAWSSQSRQSPRTVLMSNIKEALILNALRSQNGPGASVRMYGLCCRGTANSSSVNLIMEKLLPIPVDDMQIYKEQFALFFKRMAAFPLGPIEIPDFKFSSIAMNANRHIHAIDLPYVHIGDKSEDNRLQVYNYMMQCWYENNVDCFQKLSPSSRKSWSNMKAIGLTDKQYSFLVNPVRKDRQNISAHEQVEIQNLLLSTRGGNLGKVARNWKNPTQTPFGYHSIELGQLKLLGQRNPNQRLGILRKFIDFKGKVVVDLGCNVGGMLHHLHEIRFGYGFDYDARCIRAASKVAEIFWLPEMFFQADLNSFDANALYSVLHAPDIAFMFNIGSWVNNWEKLYRDVAKVVPTIVLETNNDSEGKAQLQLFSQLGKQIRFISRARDDITGNMKRKTYLITS